MTENKRFELAWEDYDGWGINDTLGEYSDDEDYIDWLSGQKAVDVLNHFVDENEQLKSENQRLKRLNTSYISIDINKVLPAIAECKGITVEEYLEEIEEEYTKEGDLE